VRLVGEIRLIHGHVVRLDGEIRLIHGHVVRHARQVVTSALREMT